MAVGHVDGDGVAELKTAFLENLNSPLGMALVGDQLYVATIRNAQLICRLGRAAS
ncbi:MAG: hypothetical protein M3R58_04530 [Pseudomonadota bacterium]|nr:hypothetical protein [Pseudomonadota bacterium]